MFEGMLWSSRAKQGMSSNTWKWPWKHVLREMGGSVRVENGTTNPSLFQHSTGREVANDPVINKQLWLSLKVQWNCVIKVLFGQYFYPYRTNRTVVHSSDLRSAPQEGVIDILSETRRWENQARINLIFWELYVTDPPIRISARLVYAHSYSGWFFVLVFTILCFWMLHTGKTTDKYTRQPYTWGRPA